MGNKKVKQESFYPHFAEGFDYGESDCEVDTIDQVDKFGDIRRGESYLEHELDTFQPIGLNEREVALFNST